MTSRKREANGDPQTPSGGNPRPPKRLRKAINCEPCRTSKLKCDRARPCSGCVLRGTIAQCYPDEASAPETPAEKDEAPAIQVDLRTEISRVRHSLNVLEAAIPRQGAFPNKSYGSHDDTSNPASPNDHSNTSPHAFLKPYVRSKLGGVYVGPTAACSALLIHRNDVDGTPFSESQDPHKNPHLGDPQYNRDILSEIPSDFNLTEGLLSFYFESCTCFTFPLNQKAFYASWGKARQSELTDHLVLSTVFAAISIACLHLPAGHVFISKLPAAPTISAARWYDASLIALSRYKSTKPPPNLELIELLLLRTQYLMIAKNDGEEAWNVKAELASGTIALGLHRDPEFWIIEQDVKIRRRWAWWNFVSMDRWLGFLFGRPLSVRPGHFDTQFPIEDVADPSATALKHPQLAYLASFRLTIILGDIVNDTISTKPVPYERIKDHDRALEQWLDMLPPDFKGDPHQMARNLALSTPLPVRRVALQSMFLQVLVYHMRVVLHRPYTNPQGTENVENAGPNASSKSFEAAIHSADMVIQYLSLTSHEFVSNIFLDVPGYIAWGGYHLFSAALFFALQLIVRPDHPNVKTYRESIERAMKSMDALKEHLPHGEKGMQVLNALIPLFDNLLDENARAEQIEAIRTLAFPCHDQPLPPRRPTSSDHRLSEPTPTNPGFSSFRVGPLEPRHASNANKSQFGGTLAAGGAVRLHQPFQTTNSTPVMLQFSSSPTAQQRQVQGPGQNVTSGSSVVSQAPRPMLTPISQTQPVPPHYGSPMSVGPGLPPSTPSRTPIQTHNPARFAPLPPPSSSRTSGGPSGTPLQGHGHGHGHPQPRAHQPPFQSQTYPSLQTAQYKEYASPHMQHGMIPGSNGNGNGNGNGRGIEQGSLGASYSPPSYGRVKPIGVPVPHWEMSGGYAGNDASNGNGNGNGNPHWMPPQGGRALEAPRQQQQQQQQRWSSA